ncbi:hypothetical protein EDD21DRAFT_89347 [Dissophora ornata]|nr:hypothetical protein EDD21DRAFT_89347 [Dissophora ornata]
MMLLVIQACSSTLLLDRNGVPLSRFLMILLCYVSSCSQVTGMLLLVCAAITRWSMGEVLVASPIVVTKLVISTDKVDIHSILHVARVIFRHFVHSKPQVLGDIFLRCDVQITQATFFRREYVHSRRIAVETIASDALFIYDFISKFLGLILDIRTNHMTPFFFPVSSCAQGLSFVNWSASAT